jgi:predicted O-methyltransferase YrrM
MESYLPEIPGVLKGIRKSRNVYEGYQRGFGLQFGNLRKQVLKDPLYKEGVRLAKGRTILSEQNRMNIFLIMRFFLHNVEPGHIIEFGSYKGGNAIFMAYVASKLHPGMRVYALDSFEGMPVVDKSVDAHNKADFHDVNLKELQEYVSKIGLNNIEFVKGYFEQTAVPVLQRAKKIALAHIDCDILSSVEYSYEAVKDHMSDGGYLVFDDANISSCIGATEAVEDLLIRRDGMNCEQIYPHFVFRTFMQQDLANVHPGAA